MNNCTKKLNNLDAMNKFLEAYITETDSEETENLNIPKVKRFNQ